MQTNRKTCVVAMAGVFGAGCTAAAVAPPPSPVAVSPATVRMNPTTATPEARLGVLPTGLGLAVGTLAPDAKIMDLQGNPQRLAELYARGPTLIVFYRGGWCPFCNFQIRELTTAAAQFRERGVQLVAISVDQPDVEAKTRAAHDVPFVLLSDPDLAAHRAFAVVHHADDTEVARLLGFGLDIEASSARKHHDFAVPSVFLVVDGHIRWAHADPDYKVRPTAAQLLAAVDALLVKR